MKNFLILSSLLCTVGLVFISNFTAAQTHSSVTQAQSSSSAKGSLIPQETLMKACQDLSENDDCQFHDDQAKRLVSGQCKMKALAGNNLTLLCIADKPTEPMDSSAETSSSEGNHKHNRKRHSD